MTIDSNIDNRKKGIGRAVNKLVKEVSINEVKKKFVKKGYNVDMMGKKCTHCKKGTFKENSVIFCSLNLNLKKTYFD